MLTAPKLASGKPIAARLQDAALQVFGTGPKRGPKARRSINRDKKCSSPCCLRARPFVDACTRAMATSTNKTWTGRPMAGSQAPDATPSLGWSESRPVALPVTPNDSDKPKGNQMIRHRASPPRSTATSRYAAITGWGYYVPDRILTNHELELMVDTSDEWIRTRTGIRERRVAGPAEATSSMSARAAERALSRARLVATDLDLVICATTTPDTLLPATACVVQARIGAVNAGAFDLSSACTGFLQGLIVGTQFIRAGTCDRVLVTAGETLSRFLNWSDRDTCVLFGDGAGAVVLEVTEQPGGILGTAFGCKGDVDHILAIEGGGSAKPASVATLAARHHYVAMRGNEIYKLAVRWMSRVAREALAQAGCSEREVRQVIPHQANIRIIRAVQENLGLPGEKVYVNVDRYGNTGAASVGIALAEYLDAASVQPGDQLLLASFGGGLTWAATLCEWADVKALVSQRDGGRLAEEAALATPATDRKPPVV